jgi:hypothetical protein
MNEPFSPELRDEPIPLPSDTLTNLSAGWSADSTVVSYPTRSLRAASAGPPAGLPGDP